jgi:hypothetical protein
MPFYGFAKLPWPDDAGDADKGILIKWLRAENDFIEANEPIAIVKIGNKQYCLFMCFRGAIEKHLARENQEIGREQDIIKWGADGESIPYGRDYFISKSNE